MFLSQTTQRVLPAALWKVHRGTKIDSGIIVFHLIIFQHKYQIWHGDSVLKYRQFNLKYIYFSHRIKERLYNKTSK